MTESTTTVGQVAIQEGLAARRRFRAPSEAYERKHRDGLAFFTQDPSREIVWPLL